MPCQTQTKSQTQWSTFSAVRHSAFHTFAAALGIAFSVRNLTMHHFTATRSDSTWFLVRIMRHIILRLFNEEWRDAWTFKCRP